jgi:hypothetical protein
MFNGKFVGALTALIIAVFAICNFTKNKTNEGLGMLPNFNKRIFTAGSKGGQETTLFPGTGGWRGNRTSSLQTALDNTVQAPEFFQTPPNFQANVSPRFANLDMGANVRYNIPSREHMAMPTNPLGYAQSVENYGCAAPACGKSGAPCVDRAPPLMKADFAAGDFHKVQEQVQDSHPSNVGVTSTLPVGDMSTVNSLGETVDNVTIYDRFVYANRNSTLRSQGDWIRGDLPITPNCTGWFQVSATPNIDLNQGAMNVLGGLDNGTAQQMAALMAQSGDTTVAGVSLTPEQLSSLGDNLSTLNVTAFP